ncbi:MAG: DUF6941 family protein [Acidimicrobiales bacterium]
MEITTALVCNWAEVREGILFVSGGGITRAWKQQFPAPFGVCLALVLEGTQGEMIGVPHEVEIEIADGDGVVAGQVTAGLQANGSPDLEPGEMMQVPLAFNLSMLPLPAVGAYDIKVRVDRGSIAGQPERVLTIRAMLGGPAAAPQES